ncbi:sensor protein KdpD [mine drainage metagenome]|uniref:histidine kinase n=1 Tax=mine drainage metagenome TaxID=410659 RepID=A0A1J5TAD6_9ZZZZ
MLGNSETQQLKRNYLFAILICVVITMLATPLRQVLDLANIVMLFLLVVFLVALKLGRGPAIMSAILAVALFDVFFVPPRFSFTVNNAQYLITFSVMLAVGLATAHLTAKLSKHAAAAVDREQNTRRLYELARDLAGASSYDEISKALSLFVAWSGYTAKLHLLDANGEFPSLSQDIALTTIAHMAIKQGALVNTSQLSDEGSLTLVLPLKSPHKVRGVLEANLEKYVGDVDKEMLEAVVNLVAIAVERLHYVALTQQTQLDATSERLRSSVLSSLSHDLRTPLTGLVGMADALALTTAQQSDSVHNAAIAIRDQALAMSHLLSNLLEMARLHSGKVALRKDWRLFEDVIGSAIKLLKPTLAQHPVTVTLAPDFPLVEFDDVLLERVLCNLLENAAKYSPLESPIEIREYISGECACIDVSDHGAGFPAGKTESLFHMFERGESESSTLGVGLGLAICSAIIEAHCGTIKAVNQAQGGACVTLCLPLGKPPIVNPEIEEA